MTAFVDSSALYALLDADDQHHREAVLGWEALKERFEELVTSNYVVLETGALLGRRVGFQAVRDLENGIVPIVRIIWIDEAIHRRAMTALLTAGLRDLSLVDCVSFEVMRIQHLHTAFAFDAHFTQQGFQPVVPNARE